MQRPTNHKYLHLADGDRWIWFRIACYIGKLRICQAKSQAQLGELKSRPFILNVQFPPSKVTVSILHHGDLLADQEVEVTCEAGSANPPAHLHWRYYHCSRIKKYMQRADHSKILLTSLNQVAKPSIEASSAQTIMPQDCEMDERIGIEDPTTEGSHGGFISRSRLLLRPEWRDHLDIVACLASNSVYNHFTKQNQIQLNVCFRPHFIGFQPGDSHSIVEGSSGTLDLIPYGNPRCSNIAWLVRGKVLKKSPIDPRTADFSKRSVKKALSKLTGLYQLDELLVIWNIKRNQTTNVTIKAENSLGTTEETFFLDVTYPAKVVGVVDANVSMGEMAVLVCMARGNPNSAINSFSWHRLLFPKWDKEANEAPAIETTSLGCNDVTRINGVIKHMVQCEDVDPFTMRSQLLVYNVTRDDVGLYSCTVDNGISASHQSQVKLFSACKDSHFGNSVAVYSCITIFFLSVAPEIVRQPKFAKVAAPFGTGAVLQCFVRVEPMPRVTWLLNRRDQEGRTTVARVLDTQCGAFVAELGVPCIKPARPKFFQTLTQIRPGYYAAKLHISAVHVSDFGQYTCKAVTASGDEDRFAIQVTGTGPPEIPYDLRLLNATALSLQVAWGQGFNGGYKQTFTVNAKLHTFLYDIVYSLVLVLENHDGFGGYHSIKAVGYSKPNSIFIIVAACVIGGMVILINIVVITYLIRKRHSRGSQTPDFSATKSHILPLEKQYRGGPEHGSSTNDAVTKVQQTVPIMVGSLFRGYTMFSGGHYCRDLHHRHMIGEHFYVSDPSKIGETAQVNSVYGYVPHGDHGLEFSDPVCKSVYMSGVPATSCINETNYPHIHRTLAGGESHTSPVPVRTLNHHSISSVPKVSKIAFGQSHQSGSKFFGRSRSRLRRRQSFSDALHRGLTANGMLNYHSRHYRSTLERLPAGSNYPDSSYPFNPLDDQQCGADSSRTLLLNGISMSESATRDTEPSASNIEWRGIPDVVV
ncbi:unnamed protein product [Hydatigera taeniaeformis]|uniref:Ig-like domain-containing protein n=1 Tax=Hydatigena taeniaeformis TaxID=6205 RepID=A0A0R3WMH9_HYDTA|nr:unnamed protein product [Hydatigera taeniaeformis]